MTDDDIRALRDDAAKLRTFVGPWLGDGQHANANGYALADRIVRMLGEIERLRVDAERLRAADERRKRRSVTYVCPQCAASMIRDGEKEERK